MRTLSFIALLTVGCGDISAKDEDTGQDASPSSDSGNRSTPVDTGSPLADDTSDGGIDSGSQDTGVTDTLSLIHI